MSDDTATKCLADCRGYRFHCRNPEEFVRICDDVFAHDEYAFRTRQRTPLIVDAGAHVGVATHYFKHRYPRARVLAFEANPVTFALLRRNIALNRLDDVRPIHAAVAPQAGEITFYASASDDEPGAWGDSAVRQPWHEDEGTAIVRVPAVTLSSVLAEPVDLLKLDIEGAEDAVLADCEPVLDRVRAMVVDLHEFDPSTRQAPRVLERLARAGFTYAIDEFVPLTWREPTAEASSPFPGKALAWAMTVRAWRSVR